MSKLISFIVALVSIATVLISCTPILGRPAFFVMIGAIIISIYLLGVTTKSYVRNRVGFVFIFAFYIIITASYRILGISDDSWGNSMHEYFFFCSYIITILLVAFSSEKQIKWAYWLFVLIMAINIADNIALSIMFPQLREYSASFDEDTLASLNAGNSSFYTFSLFYFNVLFFVFLNTSRKGIKLISLFFSTLAAVFIIGYCNKGSTVVYLFLSLFFQYFMRKAKSEKKFIITAVFLTFFGLIIVKVFNNELIQLINAVIPSERLSTRLITLINPHSSYANEDAMTGRSDLYLLSLKTWIDSPKNFLFGVGDIRDTTEAFSLGVGQHADLLDTLARYGVVGGFLVISILIIFFKNIISFFDGSYRSQLLLIVGIFIINGCTKAVLMPEVGAALFILLPLSSHLVNKTKQLF